MTQIPTDQVSMADLYAWYELAQELARLKTNERLLRDRIFGAYFPGATEGTHAVPLPDGYQLKGVAKVDRTVDPGELDALLAQVREGELAIGFNPEALIKRKPELIVSEYRKLTDEERKIFDFCLVSKPGAPSLSVEKAPEAKKRAARAKKDAPTE